MNVSDYCVVLFCVDAGNNQVGLFRVAGSKKRVKEVHYFRHVLFTVFAHSAFILHINTEC